MIKGIYAIKDLINNEFYAPMVFTNDAEAYRYFKNVINDDRLQSVMYANPADFDLWKLGEWDTNNGIETVNQKRVKNGTEVKEIG